MTRALAQKEQTEVADARRRREAGRAVAEGLRSYGAADLRGAAAALQRALDLHPQHQRAALYLGWVRRCLREQRGAVSASADGLARVLSKASDRSLRPGSGPVPRALLSFDSEPTRGEGLQLDQKARNAPVNAGSVPPDSGPHGPAEAGRTPRSASAGADELELSADSPGFAGVEGPLPTRPAQQPQELSLVMDLDGMEASARDEGGEAAVVEDEELDLAELVAAAEDWGVKLAPVGPAEGQKQAKPEARTAQQSQVSTAQSQPPATASELSLLPLEILAPLDAHQPPEQDLSKIFSAVPAGAEAPAARPERRGTEGAASAAGRSQRGGGAAQELSSIFSDTPGDADDLGELIDLADHAVQGGAASRAGQASQQEAPASSGLSMLLSDVPVSAEVRPSYPQAAPGASRAATAAPGASRAATAAPGASRAATAAPSASRSDRPGPTGSSDLSMLLSDLPLSDEPQRSSVSPLRSESPDQQNASTVSLLFSDEPAHPGARSSARHGGRNGRPSSAAPFAGSQGEPEEVLLEEVDLTEELELYEDHAGDIDVLLAGDSQDDVFVGGLATRGGGAQRPGLQQASQQSGESPQVEISLEGATPMRVPFSGSASFPPPPPSQPDVEQRLREARDALDRRDLDEAFKRAEHVMELLGGESDPAALRPYEVRLAEVYERLLVPLDRVPRVGRYPTARMEPQTAFLLSLLDGSMTIEEALTVSGMSRLLGARTMNQLLRRGLISLA